MARNHTPDSYSDPTARRLAWLRELFFQRARGSGDVPSASRLVESKNLAPEPGVVLIAPPMMHDPNFRRSVVLLCEHSPDGSAGLILNRPLGVPLAEVVRGIYDVDLPIAEGGPVQLDTLHFLHACGDLVPGNVPVVEGVYWGGDFNVMKTLIGAKQVSRRDVRFFLGYAGWAAGQLEDEIEQGGWILARADERAVFEVDPSRLWAKVLRGLGGPYAVLANFPEDPRVN